jgi:hypothetical protein
MTELHPTLEQLVTAMESIGPPPIEGWFGSVELAKSFLPFDSFDPETSEKTTVHAVIMNGVMLVSQAAWDALKKETAHD